MSCSQQIVTKKISHTHTVKDITDFNQVVGNLLVNYLPLTGGTLTGDLSATNIFLNAESLTDLKILNYDSNYDTVNTLSAAWNMGGGGDNDTTTIVQTHSASWMNSIYLSPVNAPGWYEVPINVEQAGLIITDQSTPYGSTSNFRLPSLSACVGQGVFKFLATRPNRQTQFSIYANAGDLSMGAWCFRIGRQMSQYSCYASDVGNYLELMVLPVNESQMWVSNWDGFFNLGDTVKGRDSGAIGIFMYHISDYFILLNNVTGTFINGEYIDVVDPNTLDITNQGIATITWNVPIPYKWVALNYIGNWEDRD